MDKPEFDSLFAANFVKVQRYVERRIGDRAASEEIAAETFLLAWNRRHTVDAALPWLYRTAANKIRDHYKRARRQEQAEQAITRLEEDATEPVSALDLLALDAALHTLAPREREVVMLTYWERLSAAEIGQVLKLSEGAVWTTLSRARGKLRGQLLPEATIAPGGGHEHR